MHELEDGKVYIALHNGREWEFVGPVDFVWLQSPDKIVAGRDGKKIIVSRLFAASGAEWAITTEEDGRGVLLSRGISLHVFVVNEWTRAKLE